MENRKEKYVLLPQVNLAASLRQVAERLVETGTYIAQVNSEAGEPVGWIDALEVLKRFLQGEVERPVGDIARPIESTDHLELDQNAGYFSSLQEWCQRRPQTLPYFWSREKGASGLLLFNEVLADLAEAHAQEQEKRLSAERAYANLIEQIPLGVAIIREQGDILQANRMARRIIAEAGISRQAMEEMVHKKASRIVRDRKNRYFRMWISSLGSSAPGKEPELLVLFTEVTTEYRLMDMLKNSREEAEQALAVMLPDQRITSRLRSIAEYADEYDPSTGKIRITGVLEEGVYRHVINMLRLIAEAFRQGLMELPGIEKNFLVSAAVFHDLAKVQPTLQVGETVDPKEVFEPGYLHAFRGAALGKGIYGLDEGVVNLIKYHHHAESALPPDFPPYLLPMFRFFQLVDGLSAGITRRGSQVTMEIRGSTVRVEERSSVPQYNRALTLDLYTGAVVSVPLEK